MQVFLIAIALVVGSCFPAFAQELAEGDTVRLVERDPHIPAHPAPGDNRLSFRFVGGSTAQILRIDAPTGWLEIQGEKLGGGQGTGWIIKRYIEARLTSGHPDDDDDQLPPALAWCPPKGSSAPHPSGRLRIATWNLGNLHAVDGQSTFIFPNPSVKRLAIDYMRIRCYVRLFDPDILAVQEVDGEAALSRVVDSDDYKIVVSQRPKFGNMGRMKDSKTAGSVSIKKTGSMKEAE